MKKLLSIALFFCMAACGQSPGNKINPNITNTRTKQHINIPGTRLFIIPPQDFKIATTFVGLQKGDAMLNVYDLVGGNFYTNAATFSKEAFEKQGAKVFDYQEIKVNGYPAKYISMQGDLAAKTYAIVFGDTTFSTMIMAAYPVTDEAAGKQIIGSLNTIFYDKQKKIDPFETALFSLDDNNSRFKFFQFNANLYLYTIDGLDNKNTDNPFLIVTQMPMDNTLTTKSIAEMMIAKSEQYGLTNPQVKNISTDELNGYDAYETIVYGDMKGKPASIYLLVVGKGDRAIVIEGMAKSDLEANIQGFKKLSHTIRLK